MRSAPSEPLGGARDVAVRAFLDRSTVVELATISPEGRAFVTPLWFVADDGVLYVTTGPGTRAARNIARTPGVVLLLDGGGSDRLLRLRGTATCHRGLPPWRVLLRIAAKYYLAPAAALLELRNAGRWPLRARYYAQAKGGLGYLRIVPGAGEVVERP